MEKDVALAMELRILGVAFAIGLDVLALATAIGIKGLPWKSRLILGTSFSVAEITMQIVGLGLGTGFGHIVGQVAKWIGLVVLAAIGVWILREGFSENDDFQFDVSKPLGLVAASASISLDSLGVGFALPALNLPLFPLLSTVAVSTALFTVAGLALGSFLGHVFEKNAERLAGAVLILLAAVFAFQQLHT